MIALEIAFLTGRFHGTAWHHARNEGVPEWPPSPWRVLRALVNVACAEGLDATRVQPLLEKLRGLPRYFVPPAVDAHTRHWMPDTDDAQHKRAKVFDAFVAVAGGARRPAAVRMGWSADLDRDEHDLLAHLSQRIPYLGRAESWADVRPVDANDESWNCWPDEHTPGPATNLLAVLSHDDLQQLVEGHPASARWPRTLWDVLTFEGARFRREGWSSVPGTRQVRYRFERPPFARAVAPRRPPQELRIPEVARFAIASRVLPPITHALMLGEYVRRSAMSWSKRVSGDVRGVFSGHGEVGNHRHARYLAVAIEPGNMARGVTDHILIVANGGFHSEDIRALQALRQVWIPGRSPLDLVLTGVGTVSDFGGLTEARLATLAKARVWESITPFVPTRHPKTVRGTIVDSIEDQIRHSCEQLTGFAPTHVRPLGNAFDWMMFRRRRTLGTGKRGPDRAFGATLVFPIPVAGPIAIGYGSHFGLGLFRAVG